MNYLGNFVVLAACCICGTLMLIFVVRRIPSAKRLSSNRDVVGVYFVLIGTIYAILLAFMLASVWTRFDQARSQVEQEASILVNLYHLADGLPLTRRASIQTSIRNYTHAVVDREWATMQDKRTDTQTDKTYHVLWHNVQVVSPRNNHDNNIHAQLLQQIMTLATLRRLRLLTSGSGLPDILWFVLIFGAILLLCMAGLFGMETYAQHSGVAVLLTVTVALILYATWEIDGPFSGQIVVSSEPFSKAMLAFDAIENLE